MILEFQGEYRWLSNFALVEIELGGVKYPSVEAAYQSAKWDNVSWRAYCADTENSSADVKKTSKGILVRKDWNGVKVGIMEDCLIQKYAQEPYRSLLLATGDEVIQEGNLWRDTFWGICLKTGYGANVLGTLIMQIRATLRQNDD